MAELISLLGRIVYLDTNIFIYAVEGYQPEQAFMGEFLAELERGGFAAVTSEFTLAELLVKPFELGRQDVVSAYAGLLQPSDRLAVVPVDRTILVEAARQRATLGMRMPDAIHVATALAAGCDAFLTNDRRLRLPPTIARHLI
ncbi:MAG TPA: type II toxin-antitoxin system VapC family toxin [Methylobacterium sp.]